MRISTALAFAVAVSATAGACKKDKKKDEPVVTPTPGSGSAVAGSGSAGGMTASGSGAAPVVAKLEGEALAKRYVECAGMINANQIDKFISECVAKDMKAHDASMNMDTVGADKLGAMFKDMKAAFPDMKIDPQVVLVNGRNLAAVALTTGTNSGPMKGPDGKEMPKTDKKVGMLFFHRLKFDDANKTTDEWAISDQGTMMVHLGMAPPDMKVRPVMDKGAAAPTIVAAANDDKEKANVALVQKGNDAFNAHNVADMMAVMADDVVESDLADDKDHTGKAAVQKGTEMFVKAFPDGKIETVELWGAGDYVVMVARFTGTNDGPMGPMAKTGKKVDIELAEISEIKDGKIVKLWRFRDNMTFASQLGLMKGPGDAPADPSAKPKEQ